MDMLFLQGERNLIDRWLIDDLDDVIGSYISKHGELLFETVFQWTRCPACKDTRMESELSKLDDGMLDSLRFHLT